MSTHPLVRLAEIYEILHAELNKNDVFYDGLINSCERSLSLRNNETVSTAAARTALEGQLLLEAFMVEQPLASLPLDAPHLITTMWNTTQLLRNVESRKSLYKVELSDAKLLRMAASMMTMGTTLTPTETLPTYEWLREILSEVLGDLEDSSIGKQMTLSIRRQVLQTQLILDQDPVLPDLVIRYLATLSGLLSAAAQAEPSAPKARRFMKWSVRIAGGIMIDALTGVPAASITNAILLAIDSSDDAGASDDFEDLGEAAGV